MACVAGLVSKTSQDFHQPQRRRTAKLLADAKANAATVVQTQVRVHIARQELQGRKENKGGAEAPPGAAWEEARARRARVGEEPTPA